MAHIPYMKIVANLGETNNGFTRYHRLGTILYNTKGYFYMSLDSIPVGCPNWDGYASLYEFNERDKEWDKIKELKKSSKVSQQEMDNKFREGNEIPF